MTTDGDRSPDAAKGPAAFLRDYVRALTDEGTYDVRLNPSLWMGFLVGLPTPLLTFAAQAPVWLKLVSLAAPVLMAVIMGAAGRVGVIAQLRAERAQHAAVEIKEHLEVTEEALGEEVLRRQALQAEQEDILSDLELAEAVNRTLQPEQIARDDVIVASKSVPSRFVGGDYIHVNVVDNRWLYLCTFDVSGHGVSASLVVARIHGLVRRLTLTKQTPVMMLQRINGAAVRILKHTFFFMTGIAGRLDLETGKFQYATAGHPSQFLLRKSGAVKLLRTPNRLMGVDDDIFDSENPSKHVMLEPGDELVLFTDGLFEVLEDGRDELLGETGLLDRVRQIGPMEPSLLLGEVLQELGEFQGRTQFDDDVSLVVAQYLGRPPPAEPGSAAQS